MTSVPKKRVFYKTWTFWIVASFSTPVLLVLLFYVYGTSRYSQAIEGLKAAGQPTNLAELNDFYCMPVAATDSTSHWVAAIDSVDETALTDATKFLPYVGTLDVPEWRQEWKQLPLAKTFLDEQQVTVQLIRKAIAADGIARFDVDYSVAPLNAAVGHAEEFRTLGRMLCLDNLVAASDKDFDRIHANILGLFQMSRALKLECTLIGQLIRNSLVMIAIEQTEIYLPESQWGDQQLAQLQNKASNLELKDALRNAEIGERAFSLDMMNQMSPVLTLGHTPQLDLLAFYEQRFEASDSQWHQHLAAHAKLDSALKKRTGFIDSIRLMPFQLMAPAAYQMTASFARTAAQQRTFIAALAIERFRLEKGQVDLELMQIPDRYFPSPTDINRWVDPFTGERLLTARSATSYTVYSVGDDQKDDHGDVASTEGQTESDVGFRLRFLAVDQP